MTTSDWPPSPNWTDPEVLWRSKECDATLVRITNPDDLVRFGAWMGHSGGRYQHWAIDRGIWHFMTLLDSNGAPHCTLHGKDAAWYKCSHPDDTKALCQWPWGFGPSPVDRKGRAKFWLPSTMYDAKPRVPFDKPIILDNKEVLLIGVGHRDCDPLLPSERRVLMEWYDDAAR